LRTLTLTICTRISLRSSNARVATRSLLSKMPRTAAVMYLQLKPA
jgi:hypothetical protein